MTTPYKALPISPEALKALRVTDDAGNPTVAFTDPEGGAPLRCCLRRSAPGDRIALISYAPLRRWAAESGATPGPYDEQGPAFIHAEPCQPPNHNTYPLITAPRVLRRYSTEGRILGGHLLTDTDLSTETITQAFTEAFSDPEVALVHVRAVEYGCFFYEVRR
ncbi:DUF1203 domain-containing protein [Nocardia crassostreae]|uniref:DUF1203 domain-containing protein n=1 Tax=Nocardia crassostreae TaxID=53428 RepID=UPI0008343DFA|nr:DUF1203 domain-containing protein [Nocardia crassostreae]